MKENVPLDLDTLEEVKVKIEPNAFQPSVLHCSTCKLKMKKTELEVQIDRRLYLRLNGFECTKCQKISRFRRSKENG